MIATVRVMAQPSGQSLEQIKVAADAGDPAAQDKLAEQFIMRLDTAQAEVWYRKAANQGYAHAQGKLGDMLLLRSKTAIGLKSQEKAALGEEALNWAMLAANQGDAQGEADMASICFEGKLVKPDFVEAYKWGELSARGAGPFSTAGISGQSIRSAAILKMDADQIAEAKRRVAEFKPHAVQKNEMPEPAWVKSIKLKGISDSPSHRMAIINDKVFEKGDENVVKADGKAIRVTCLEIGATSVRVSIKGIDGETELKMSGH
jgi:hypothetical protein